MTQEHLFTEGFGECHRYIRATCLDYVTHHVLNDIMLQVTCLVIVKMPNVLI